MVLIYLFDILEFFGESEEKIYYQPTDPSLFRQGRVRGNKNIFLTWPYTCFYYTFNFVIIFFFFLSLKPFKMFFMTLLVW